MINRKFIISSIAMSLLTSSHVLWAGEADTIYGSELMTKQERLEYRKKVMDAKSAAEREQIRQEHHVMMQERAKAQGKSLPEAPPAGRGMGSGGGMGGNP